MRKSAAQRVTAFGAAAVAFTMILTGCSASSAGGTTENVSKSDITKAMNTPTTLNYWSWLPNVNDEVKLFEKKYPKIKVTVNNVGQGAPYYSKLTNAISAGKGEPDVVQIEFQYVPQFELTKSLLDLAPYGAGDLKSEFSESTWNQVTQGKQIFAVPQDSGPMGNLYRKDIFDKAGITTPPVTWDEFAVAAATVKSKTGSYITNLPPNNAGTYIGLLWQAGVKPFTYAGGKTVGVSIDTAKARQVGSYWNDLLSKDLVGVDPDYTTQWYQGLNKGKYASWLTAAWGPVFLQGEAKDTAGLWRAAPLPQYSASAKVSANLGGSTSAVLKSTKNQIAAYELAKFINTDPASVKMLNEKQSLFPPQTSLLNSAAFKAEEAPFYGGQKVNALFAQITDTVDPNFEWPPFMGYVYSSYNNTLGKAIADKTDLNVGLKAWQASIVSYATGQGFTVKQ
jgi:multiple sugar transport system substrate-binding protein